MKHTTQSETGTTIYSNYKNNSFSAVMYMQTGSVNDLEVLTSQRCCGAPETQKSRCQWDDNANLATPAFHQENLPQTEHRGDLVEDKPQEKGVRQQTAL